MANRIKGFCSHCFKKSYHIEQQWNILRRNTYVCEECNKATLQCRLCQNFAKGGSFYDDELCAEHDMTIKSFEEINKKKIYKILEDIKQLDSKVGYELQKIKNGQGDIILFINGFLTEDDSDIKKWETELRKIYPNNPWYKLSWKSKNKKEVFLKGAFKQFISKKLFVPIPILHIPLAMHDIVTVWREAKESAEQTGIHLGNALKEIKNRQIILYGHSLGTKVIYHLLIQISQQKPKINKGIIKEVHLLGGAESDSSDNWNYAKQCVSGKIFNYYSKNDSVLKYLYQTAEINTTNPIGRNPINIEGVINKDVSDKVSGHFQYISNLNQVVRYYI